MIGENGAGKSTTLKTILNICHVDAGTITFYGKEINTLSLSDKENIGVVFDDSVFYENLSAFELEKIFSKIYKKWDRNYYLELLTKLDIPTDKKLAEYSKGMKTKLSVICALSIFGARQKQLLSFLTANAERETLDPQFKIRSSPATKGKT